MPSTSEQRLSELGEKMNEVKLSRETYLFNTPLETGLRCLVILAGLENKAIDIQRLIYLDYLLTHYGDVEPEVESLHPSIPSRSGEILIKRDLVSQGLHLMISKKLINIEYGKNGILYGATSYSKAFLQHFESKYMLRLLDVNKLLIDKFSNYTDVELKNFIMRNIDRWGGEFVKEAFVRGGN